VCVCVCLCGVCVCVCVCMCLYVRFRTDGAVVAQRHFLCGSRTATRLLAVGPGTARLQAIGPGTARLPAVRMRTSKAKAATRARKATPGATGRRPRHCQAAGATHLTDRGGFMNDGRTTAAVCKSDSVLQTDF
jgi:hypothetical protein